MKILGLSDSPILATGFASVTCEVFNRLADYPNYDIKVIGHALQASRGPISPPVNIGSEQIKFGLLGQRAQAYAADILQDYIRAEKPDIQWTLLDTFMVFPWYLNIDFAPAKSVFYFPSDGEYFPANCERILQKCNYPVAMAKFGQKQVKDLFGINAHYIPHGVETKHFVPINLEEKEAIKQKYGIGGKFVVGWVARNQGRKMLDRGLKAFAEFAVGKDDVILLIHSDPRDMAAVNDLLRLATQLKVIHKIRFTGTTYAQQFPRNKMPEVYQLMDVFFLSTSGEGFGIPTIEAMSCEIPVAVTDYTTTQELVTEHKSGIAIPLAGTETRKLKIKSGELTGSWNVERGIMDIPAATDALETLYADAKLRQAYGRNGRKACLQYYQWDEIAKQWDEFFRKILQ